MSKKKVVEEWFNENKEFVAMLKEGGKDAIINAIVLSGYEERNGKLVNPTNNLVADTDAIVRGASRAWIKPLSTGRYMGRFRDERSPIEKENQQKATRAMLESWLEKQGYKFQAEEPVRVWLDTISKSMVYETDGVNSFVLATLVNGVPSKKWKPADLFSVIGQYVDQDKTTLNKLRTEAKQKEEALRLSGMTWSDLKDSGNKNSFDSVLKLIQDEFNAQPTQKRLPDIGEGPLLADLEKQIAYEWNLNIDKSTWTLQERTTIKGLAQNYIDEEGSKPIDTLKNYTSSRPVTFFQQVQENYPGLPYLKDNDKIEL